MEIITTLIDVKGKNCMGCKRHNQDVMVTFMDAKTNELVDVFMTTKFAQNLVTQTNTVLKDNKEIELEEFYEQSCEDWHLWNEIEDGPYPVQRMLDALKNFKERNLVV
jgi:hypothetical protein